jgi:hypothetical protein
MAHLMPTLDLVLIASSTRLRHSNKSIDLRHNAQMAKYWIKMHSVRSIYFLSTVEYLPPARYLCDAGGRTEMTMTDYRKRADECVEIAQTARTAAQRTMLLHIAETWMNLAREAERSSSPGNVTDESRSALSLN